MVPTIRFARRRSAACVLASFAFAALAALPSCRPTAAPPVPHPLVLVGADGLEWRLVAGMRAAGRLPHLDAIAREGATARLKTLAPALSPPIWTSMATGVVPARHGILGFVRADARDAAGRPLLFTNRDRRVKAIWNVAEDAGLSACIVGYWMTFPVEELRGTMIAQTASPPGDGAHQRKGALAPGLEGQVHPPAYAPRVFGIVERSRAIADARERALFGDTSAWPPAMQRLVRHSRWSLEADTAYQQIALDLVRERGRCDLVIVYLGLPDVLGHRFWRWTSPGDFASPPPAAEVATFGDVLRRAYEQVDAFVGELREAAGEDATIVVASDHGMGPFRPRSVPDLSREDGDLVRTGGHSAARHAFLAAAGPAAAQRAAHEDAAPPVAGSVVDFAPTMLAMLGLPRGADMDGVVLTPLVRDRFLAVHPLREVPTHTPDGWAATRRLAAAAADPDGSERIEQLRGLGYLE